MANRSQHRTVVLELTPVELHHVQAGLSHLMSSLLTQRETAPDSQKDAMWQSFGECVALLSRTMEKR